MPVCRVCSMPSKYCCPKCKVNSCSLPHYKSHNLFCTQQFYQKQVESQLHNLKSSPHDQKKMREILKNAELDDQISDTAKQRYEQLLEMIENGESLKLTHAEEVRFVQWMEKWVVQEGETMFWEEDDGMSEYYLTEIHSETHTNPEDEEQDSELKNQQLIFYRRQYKQMINSLLPISSLCPSPHPSVIYHIYALTLTGCIGFRYFDHQVSANPLQFSSFILKICPLSSLPPFQSISSTHYFLQSQQHSTLMTPWLLISRNDTQKLWKNKYLVLQMLLRINETVSSKKTNKKIDFYCSYIKDNEQKVKKLENEIQEYVVVREVEKQGKQHLQKYKGLINV